jgi:hypothetical protein
MVNRAGCCYAVPGLVTCGMAKRRPSSGPALNANALKQGAWRRRQKFRRAVDLIEYPRDAVHSALINTGRLPPTEIKHRDRVAAELSVVIAEWAARVNRHFRAQAISRAIVRKRRDISAEVEART